MFPTRIEIIPAEDIVIKVEAVVHLTTALAVTCPPHHGIAETMRTAVELSLLGYQVIPHLSARVLRDRSELAGILRDCEAAGITEVLAVGGDSMEQHGPYASCLTLMEDIAEMTGGRMSVGIAGYPEGHTSVGALHLLDSLIAKKHLASHIVTQMCFSASKISAYVEVLRREGVDLPIWAGVAGPIPRTQLLSLVSTIGVGPSLKLLSRNGPLARRSLSGGSYSPDGLISDLSAIPGLLSGIHIHSFNNLDSSPTTDFETQGCHKHLSMTNQINSQ